MNNPKVFFKNLDEIVIAVRSFASKPKIAIVPCTDRNSVVAGLQAYVRGVAEPIFIGDLEKMDSSWLLPGLSFTQFTMINCQDPFEAVRIAISLFKQQEVSFIMKGLIKTDDLLREILNKNSGIPPAGILSHVTIFNHPRAEKLMLLTDAGVNINPTIQRKIDIIKNAIGIAKKIGIDTPKVAVLAATEKVSYVSMAATRDADILTKLGAMGLFENAVVSGPLSLDLAVSEESAAVKGSSDPVAGKADILCAPNIECGNILYKSLGVMANIKLAGLVIGSAIPLICPSRGDSDSAKFYSIAVASFLTSRK
jgi:phosphate butyryltransferase